MLFFNLIPEEERPDAFCESCIGKIAAGDKNALSALYDKTKSAVYGFALSITKNPQDAEDVLQDTFVSIYASAQRYKKLGKPMAWIFTIARNLALMKIRKRRNTVDISEYDWGLFAAREASITSEDKIILAATLKTLSSEESQIIMLHAVAGFKHREIAQLLELPLPTVLSKYSRAIKKLKSALNGGNADVK